MSVEDHVAKALTFWVVLSLHIPLALNCAVDPGATSELVGLTVILLRVAELTVSDVELLLVTLA